VLAIDVDAGTTLVTALGSGFGLNMENNPDVGFAGTLTAFAVSGLDLQADRGAIVDDLRMLLTEKRLTAVDVVSRYPRYPLDTSTYVPHIIREKSI
jgi:hypothetical protein